MKKLIFIFVAAFSVCVFAEDERASGLSVICDLFDARPAKNEEGVWYKVNSYKYPRIVFKAARVVFGENQGEIYIEKDGAKISQFTDSGLWGRPSGIRWDAYFGPAGNRTKYHVHFELTGFSGLFYEDGSVKGFVDGCQLIEKPGLPADL